MLIHYLKIAFRQILKNKVQYTLSILGIAVGLLCFSMFNYFLQREIYTYKEWPNHDRMAYCRIEKKQEGRIFNVSPTDKELQLFLENPIAGIEKIAFKKSLNAVINFSHDDKEIEFQTHKIAVVNNNFFDIYSYQTVEGVACNLNANEIFISQSFAKKLFGNENPIGKNISIKSSDSSGFNMLKTVVGIIDDQLKSIDEIYCLYEYNIEKISEFPEIMFLLAPNVTLKEINLRFKKQFPIIDDDGNEKSISVKMIKERYNTPEVWAKVGIVLFIASLILISAMTNFLKFSIQSFLNRTRELSLRKSLGSNNARLFFLLLTEVIIVLSISMVITFIMTKTFLEIIYEYLTPFFDPNQSFSLKTFIVNEWVLFFQQVKSIFYLFIISTFICFFVLLKDKWTNIIVGIKSAGRGKHGVRNFFLGFQLMICLFFVGISVTVIDFYRIQTDVNITLSKKDCARILIPRIKSNQLTNDDLHVIISEIKELSYLEDILFYSQGGKSITLSNEQKIYIKRHDVSDNYDQFMNLPITGKRPQNENEILISQALRQALVNASEDVSNLKIGDSFFQVTGTYEVFPFRNAKEDFSTITYLPYFESSEFHVKVVAGYEKEMEESLIKIIQDRIPDYDPIQMINFGELTHLPEDYLGVEILKDFLLLFSIISLLIASLGIYSAIILDTRGRQKEVAIRKINGAGKKEIALLFGKLYIKALIISAIIVLPVCYYLVYLTRTDIPLPFTPIHWIINVLIVSSIVFITVFWQIRKVAHTNPAEIIKSE